MSTPAVLTKPLGGKAYGHIPHLPGSRLGPGDHHCHEGQARICLEKTRDKHDFVTVTEKLDGSCVAVARLGTEIAALGRAGWPAQSSPYEQQQLFAHWVRLNVERFRRLLEDEERAVGEWLAQAHGTRYALPHEPFVIFDIMAGAVRIPTMLARERAMRCGFIVPALLSEGSAVFSVAQAQKEILISRHGALDPVEGAVWRIERRGQFDFLAKWLRPDKQDGSLLPEVSGGEPIWNWRPANK